MNEVTEILVTKTVVTYRIIALMKNENKPIVIKLSGKEIILKIGFKIKNKTVRTIPPTMYVGNPPEMRTPSKIKDNAYKEIV